MTEPVRIKKHPLLLVELYHVLEERSKGTPGIFRAEVLRAIDALFRIPIVEAKDVSAGGFGANQLNTWCALETAAVAITNIVLTRASLKSTCLFCRNRRQTIRVKTAVEAEGLIMLCAAARAAAGLSIGPESIAGGCNQNEMYKKAVLNAAKVSWSDDKDTRRQALRDFLMKVLKANSRALKQIVAWEVQERD